MEEKCQLSRMCWHTITHIDIFSKLNDKQTLAVQNTEGYIRVIAGAGSGKTKLLVSRYAYANFSLTKAFL